MEKILVTSEELQQLKKFQSDSSQLLLDLGEIEVQLININQLKQQTLEKYQQFQLGQRQFASEISKKYGEGMIDLTTGEFKKS